MSFAQTPPTKEHTVQFIKEFFSKPKPASGWYSRRGVKKQLKLKEQEVQFVENSFKVTFNTELLTITNTAGKETEACAKRRSIIDLRRVKHIYVFRQAISTDKFEISLMFETAGNHIQVFENPESENKVINSCSDITLPAKPILTNRTSFVIAYANMDKQGNIPYNEKILEAFIHLSRLNGAPIPPEKKCFELVVNTGRK